MTPNSTSSKSRIIFIVPGFPKDDNDTTSVPAHQSLIRAFATKRPDLDIHVIALQYPFNASNYRLGKIQVHALGGANRSRIRQVGLMRRASSLLEDLHNEDPIKVIHSHWLGKTTLLGQRMNAKYGIRHISSIGGQEVTKPNALLKFIKWNRLVLTAGSEFASEIFVSKGGKRCDEIIPLGLDVDLLNQISSPSERDIDLIGVGSLIPLKAFDQFLSLLADLAEERPNIRAILVGDGPEKENLRRQVQDLGISENIEFAGHLPRPDVIDLMRRSRILIHPSTYESQGFVFLEALFSGLDVVARPVGYQPESDRMWKCESLDEMGQAVRTILDRPSDYSPQIHFTSDQSVDAFGKIYGIEST